MANRSVPSPRQSEPSPERSWTSEWLWPRLDDLITQSWSDLSRETRSAWLLAVFSVPLWLAVVRVSQAFAAEYVIEDDAREHVFWALRYVDPELFPGDWIANYFQTLSPPGYAALYKLFASAGIDPISLSKVLPIAIAFGITGFLFAFSLQVLRVPVAALIATLLVNVGFATFESGTPRGFSLLIIVVFAYFVARRFTPGIVAAVVLGGLFYPPTLPLLGGVLLLRLITWRDGSPQWSNDPARRSGAVAGICTAAVVLLPFYLAQSAYGPGIWAHVAEQLPEFQRDGRVAVFIGQGEWRYWMIREHTGLLPAEWLRAPARYFVWLLPLAASLPLLLAKPTRFPLAAQVNHTRLLLRFMITGLALYLVAHLLMFRLYSPSRYSQQVAWLVFSVAVGLAITLLLSGGKRWADGAPTQEHRHRRRKAVAFSFAGFAFLLVAYPALYLLPGHRLPNHFVLGTEPTLYQFLQSQPKATLVASLSLEADNLPAFARRPVLFSRETAIPFQPGYYDEMRRRALDLITAQYALDEARMQEVTRRYGVDYWLLDKNAYDVNHLRSNWWAPIYPEAAQEATTALQAGTPAMARALTRCEVLATPAHTLLSAKCLLEE